MSNIGKALKTYDKYWASLQNYWQYYRAFWNSAPALCDLKQTKGRKLWKKLGFSEILDKAESRLKIVQIW